MRGVWTIVGVAVVVGLAILGYYALSPQDEPPGPTVAEIAPDTASEPQAVEPPAGADARDAETAETKGATTASAPQPQPEPEPMAAATAPTGQAEPEPSIAVQPRADAPATGGATAAETPPSFDIVRVEPSGEAVIAGRATPGSVITVLDGDRVLGKVTADWRGQWVLVLDAPLRPGSHELSLQATSTSGETLLSKNVVVVSVPEPPVVVAEAEQAPAVPEPAAPARQAEAVTAREPAPSAAPQPDVMAQVAAVEPLETAAGDVLPQPMAAELERPLAVLLPRDGIGPSRILQRPERTAEGLGEGTLILESIDYDMNRLTTVGGRAEPGARLIIYVDGKPVGHAVAGADGRWALLLDLQVSAGLHRLRIDQVNDQGRVTARVETPFLRAVIAAELPDETSVIVQPGNSLWRIARRVYGEGLRYTVIYQANNQQIRNPDLIYPGQVFTVPTTN